MIYVREGRTGEDMVCTLSQNWPGSDEMLARREPSTTVGLAGDGELQASGRKV